MATVGAFEAKTHFAQLLQRVERGEEITITRRGKAVARLVPARTRPDREVALATFRRLRERARRSGLGKFDWAEWRIYRDQGRPLTLVVALLFVPFFAEAESAVASDFWRAAGFRCQLTHGSYGQWEFWDYPGMTLDPKVSHDVTELVVTAVNPETETATVVGNVAVTTVKVHGFEHAISFFEPGAEGTAGLTIWDTPIETTEGIRYPIAVSFHYTFSPADSRPFPIPYQLYGLCEALPKQTQ